MKAKTVKINYRNQNSEHIHGPGDLSKWKRGKDMDDIIGKKILKNTKKEDQGKNPWASVVTEKNVLNKLITETALLQQKAQPAGQQGKFGSLKKWSLDTSGQIFNWVCLFNQVWHSHNPRSTCYLRIVEPAVVSPGSKKKTAKLNTEVLEVSELCVIPAFFLPLSTLHNTLLFAFSTKPLLCVKQRGFKWLSQTTSDHRGGNRWAVVSGAWQQVHPGSTQKRRP